MSTVVSIVETPVDTIATDSRSGGQEKRPGSQSGEPLSPIRLLLAGLGLDASAHRMVSQLADRAIDIRLVTFHGYVHDQEMLLARQVRAADDHPARWRACPRATGAESRSSQDLAFSLSEFRRAFSNIRGPRHRGRVVPAAVRAIRPVLRAIRAVSIFGPSDTRNAVLYASCGLRVVAREAGNL